MADQRCVVRVLGPVEVLINDAACPLRPMARRLLAVLAAARGRVVRAESILEQLWPDGSPATAAKTLQTHVVHLRRTLGQQSIIYRSAGYSLNVDAVELDAAELEQRVIQAERLIGRAAFNDALVELVVAGALVRGVPFDEFAVDEFAASEVARLSELAWRATELRADCALQIGDARATVAALEGLVIEQPLRESAWATLLNVLVACGRTADAIRAGDRAVDVLRRELDAMPGPVLAAAIASIPRAVEHSRKTNWSSEISVSNVAMVPRERLLRRVADRFKRRLTILEAGAGFGKSTLLAQALEQNRLTRFGEDRYWRCTSTESTFGGFALALCALFEISLPDDLERIPGLIASRIWSVAPRHVAIVLDDAHFLWASVENEMLSDVLDELPTNGHVVVATRTAVPLATARLAAVGQLETIGEEELCFNEVERSEFCALRGVSPSGFGWVWPAMAELAVRGGAVPTEYLHHEILANAGAGARRALEAVVLLGGADEELASTLLSSPANLATELGRLPLMFHDASARWTAHAMWSDHVEVDLTAPQWQDGLLAASRLLSTREEYGRAVRLLYDAGRQREMLHVMKAACIDFEPAVSYLELTQWAGLIHAPLADDPIALLVRAFALSRGDQRSAQDAMVAAAVALGTTTDVRSELNAISKLVGSVFEAAIYPI